MKPLKSQDYYEILGVPRQSSQEDIRRAFEISKHTYQDDSLATYSLFTEQETREIFALSSQAYETLGNPGSRREYDSFLARKEGKLGKDPGEGERMVASMVGVKAQAGPPPPARAPADAPGGARGNTPPRGKTAPASQGGKAGPAAPTAESDAAEKFIQSVTQFTGPVLKKIRELRAISLEQLADRTKIRKTYLEYIENESFEYLPAPVYVKGFVTTIAAVLELPPKDAATSYMANYTAKQQAQPQ